jgi:hypothetical protein
MENRYTNIKHLGKGIIAFDTVKNIWLITMNDIGYRPTCAWLKTCQFRGRVHYHLMGDSRREVLEKFANTL